MNKYLLTDIDWDTDGAAIELPSEMVVDAEDEESAVDVASDMMGFCINGAAVQEAEKLEYEAARS